LKSVRVSGNLTLNKERGQSWWSFLRDNPSEGDGCGRKMGPIAYVVSEEVPPSKFLKPFPLDKHDDYHIQCMLVDR
jgi:hypothetical protein